MHDTISRILRPARRKRIFAFCTAPEVSARHTSYCVDDPSRSGCTSLHLDSCTTLKAGFCHGSRATTGNYLLTGEGQPRGTSNSHGVGDGPMGFSGPINHGCASIARICPLYDIHAFHIPRSGARDRKEKEYGGNTPAQRGPKVWRCISSPLSTRPPISAECNYRTR
jgi:hypothetical protein